MVTSCWLNSIKSNNIICFPDTPHPPASLHTDLIACCQLNFHIFSLGYSDEKTARLTKEAISAGFSHFKFGADQADDVRRGKLTRSIIDNREFLPPGVKPFDRNGDDYRERMQARLGRS